MRTDDLIVVKAEIRMMATKEGGRQSGFKSGYRPNHVFEPADNPGNLTAYVGEIVFEDQDLLQPGEAKIVTVRFLRISQIEKYITIGSNWFINEGAKTIGFGEILEILDFPKSQ